PYLVPDSSRRSRSVFSRVSSWRTSTLRSVPLTRRVMVIVVAAYEPRVYHSVKLGCARVLFVWVGYRRRRGTGREAVGDGFVQSAFFFLFLFFLFLFFLFLFFLFLFFLFLFFLLLWFGTRRFGTLRRLAFARLHSHLGPLE